MSTNEFPGSNTHTHTSKKRSQTKIKHLLCFVFSLTFSLTHMHTLTSKNQLKLKGKTSNRRQNGENPWMNRTSDRTIERVGKAYDFPLLINVSLARAHLQKPFVSSSTQHEKQTNWANEHGNGHGNVCKWEWDGMKTKQQTDRFVKATAGMCLHCDEKNIGEQEQRNPVTRHRHALHSRRICNQLRSRPVRIHMFILLSSSVCIGSARERDAVFVVFARAFIDANFSRVFWLLSYFLCRFFLNRSWYSSCSDSFFFVWIDPFTFGTWPNRKSITSWTVNELQKKKTYADINRIVNRFYGPSSNKRIRTEL